MRLTPPALVLSLLGAGLGCSSRAASIVGEGLLVVTVTPAPLEPPRPSEPIELEGYHVEAVRSALPAHGSGTVRVVPSAGQPLLDALRGEGGRVGTHATEALLLEEGALSLGELVAELDDAALAAHDDDAVLLRAPLVIAPGTTLIVHGAETPVVRLSTDAGALVANGGALHVVDAHVTSWSEREGGPSLFRDESEFRPFLVSFIRSRTELAGSRFEHLGYLAPRAYGVSLSSHPESFGDDESDWPSGVLIGNEFNGLFYGFYSFEARDVALVGNVYTDSIRYGIDPHDRSTRLLIARNTTRRTRERHGIIGSREVNDSWIIDNLSYDNAGSGIVLDRDCTNNRIRGNLVYGNGQGIALYESSHNVLEDNLVAFNAQSALRVRNSIAIQAFDELWVGNGDYALDLAARLLDDDEERLAAGDHYEPRLELEVHGATIAQNRGLAKASGLDALTLSDLRQDIPIEALAAVLGADVGRLDARNSFGAGGDLAPYGAVLRRAFGGEGVEVRRDRRMGSEGRD